MGSKEYKKIILDKLHITLKPRGFKKSGGSFKLTNSEMAYFINLQSSQSSTLATLKTTLNLEIASLTLAQLEDGLPASKHIRHWTERIGFFLEEPFDKWWTIHSLHDADIAANEIVDIIENRVLNEFKKLRTTADLANLWRNNKCPGLTEFQRLEYLKLVDALK